MKVLAFIFSFYILALSILPCNDKMDCKYLSDQTTSPVSTTDQRDHHKDNENCAPFCVCTCCGQTFCSEYFNTVIPNIFNTASQHFSVYTSSFVSEVYFNIWQPPKLV